MLVGEILKGYKHYLIAASVCVLLSTAFAYAVPYVTSFTLDYVIQGVDKSTPAFLLPLLDRLGGRAFFLSRLYLCGLTLFRVYGIELPVYVPSPPQRRLRFGRAGKRPSRPLSTAIWRTCPYDYHKHAATGDLVQRCTSDVDTVRKFIQMQLMEIVRTLVMFTLAAIVMFTINVKMTLVSLAFLPVLTVLFVRVLQVGYEVTSPPRTRRKARSRPCCRRT